MLAAEFHFYGLGSCLPHTELSSQYSNFIYQIKLNPMYAIFYVNGKGVSSQVLWRKEITGEKGTSEHDTKTCFKERKNYT